MGSWALLLLQLLDLLLTEDVKSLPFLLDLFGLLRSQMTR